MPTGPWYISAAAVRDYLALRGRLVVDDGPAFDHASDELVRIAAETVASGRQPTPTDTGALRYRGPKPLRLRLIVTRGRRAEGDLPQLVAVLPGSDALRGPSRAR